MTVHKTHCQCLQRGRAKARVIDEKTKLYVCVDCRRPINGGIQIFLYECNLCEQEFPKNFRHPAFHFDRPMCWDCLEYASPNEQAYLYVAPFVKVPPPPVAEPVEANFDPDLSDFELEI